MPLKPHPSTLSVDLFRWFMGRCTRGHWRDQLDDIRVQAVADVEHLKEVLEELELKKSKSLQQLQIATACLVSTNDALGANNALVGADGLKVDGNGVAIEMSPIPEIMSLGPRYEVAAAVKKMKTKTKTKTKKKKKTPSASASANERKAQRDEYRASTWDGLD